MTAIATRKPTNLLRNSIVSLIEHQHTVNPFIWWTIPEMYRELCNDFRALTIEGLKAELLAMHKAKLLTLHPWTQAIATLPKGHEAFLIEHGHEMKYYISRR